MSCNTRLTSCRSCSSQHKTNSPREWQLPLDLNSLTHAERPPKLIQVNDCLCPCFGFQICYEAPQGFWKLLENTSCWKTGCEQYPLLFHVSFCLVMDHVSEDTELISSPRGPRWVTICSIAFHSTGVSQVMKNPTFAVAPVKCRGYLQLDLFISVGHSIQGWKSTFTLNKDDQLRKIEKYWIGSFKTVKKTPRSAAGLIPEGFFLALKYLLGHSLILQMAGRPLPY